jgi:DNA-binding response OmpR family regulator
MIAVQQTTLLRVLVVDDCADTTRTLSLLLQMWGHEAYVAHDGFAALEAARLYEPDVVLLDIGLPRLDGWELARRLRLQAGSNEPQLVVLTGYGQEADRQRAHELGIDHFFIKPVEPEDLKQVLAAVPRAAASGVA